MNRPAFNELDTVALTEDVPHHGLVRGQVGVIVHAHGGGGGGSDDAYEVEFVDPQGKTYAIATLTGRQLLLLHHRPVEAA